MKSPSPGYQQVLALVEAGQSLLDLGNESCHVHLNLDSASDVSRLILIQHGASHPFSKSL